VSGFLDDGDRILDLVGVALAATILLSVAVMVFAAATVPSQAPADPPAANWTLDRANDTHVRITHVGGEPVSAASLVVTADGTERRVDGWSGVVARGDGGVVHAREGRIVRLYWTTDEGERVRLASWEEAR
jgi:FlaG/FlaF family flagellin (archaellin)